MDGNQRLRGVRRRAHRERRASALTRRATYTARDLFARNRVLAQVERHLHGRVAEREHRHSRQALALFVVELAVEAGGVAHVAVVVVRLCKPAAAVLGCQRLGCAKAGAGRCEAPGGRVRRKRTH